MGRLLGKFIGGTFVSGETPSGTVNGTNVTFTLANAPTSAAALVLAQNGLILASAEYSLSGATITMATAPASGQTLTAHYVKQT